MWKRILLILIAVLFMVGTAYATYPIKNADTDITTYFVLRDTSGDPCTAVTITDIDLYYQEYRLAQHTCKVGATTLASAADVHDPCGVIHCGNGLYRVDWENEAFNGGIGKPVTLIVTVPGKNIITAYLELVLQPRVDVQTVLEETPFDATNDTVDVGKISGDATSANNLELAFDGTGYGYTNCTMPTTTDITNEVVLADNSITAAKIDTGAIGADEIAANAIGASEIAAGAIGVTEFTALNAVTTTVATSNTAQSFTLTDGVAVNDAYNFMFIIIKDAGDSHYEVRLICDYTSAKVVTVDNNFYFTPAVGDEVRVMNLASIFHR